MLTIFGTKKDKGIQASKDQMMLRQQYMDSLKEGTEVSVTYKTIGQAKTHKQVKTHFGLVIATILEAFNDRGWDTSILLGGGTSGVPVSKGLLQEYLYIVCPMYDDDGNRITLSNKNVTSVKCSQWFDDIRNYAASKWYIVIPDPNPEWRKEKQ